jgi:endonuclease/exonuclease/phosphatase family metal-dependent hydrolase
LIGFTLLFLLFLQFAPHLAKGQPIPARGTDATFDVATWNIEWFGSTTNGPADDARQLANVQAVIEQADIDLWGVQEIADPTDFNALLDALGDGYDGVLATESGTQRIGFIYKTNILSNVVVRHILTTFSFEFAGRLPLQLEADVTVGAETRRLTFIVLHMKAFDDQASYERRVEAAQRLKNHIDFLRPNDPILVLGDFNDELEASITAGRPSPYLNFVDDTAHYAFLTVPLDQRDEGTYCDNSLCTAGSTIDHLLITDELFPLYETDSAARFEELVTSLSGYVTTTSDHLPVFARFRLDTSTAVEDDAMPPDAARAALIGNAPNPFRDATTITFSLPHAGPVELTVYNVLGQRILTRRAVYGAPGLHAMTIEATDGMVSGVYFYRLATNAGVVAGMMVHRP